MSLTRAYNIHKKLGAQMVKYAGYMLPMSYTTTNLTTNTQQGGILKETLNTRNKDKCSIFDVSHMGQYRIYGDNRHQFLDNLVVSDILGLARNKSILSAFTNENAGIMDDVIITNQGDHLNIVCNGANRSKIQTHLEHCKTNEVDIDYTTGNQLYAIQGPQSINVLVEILRKYLVNDRILHQIKHTEFMNHIPISLDGKQCDVYTQGYTGEKGIEVSLPDEIAQEFFIHILNHPKTHAAGLGSRDILRLEAGYCLYGQEIDETTNVFEAQMGWTVSKNKRKRNNFPGSHLILNEDGSVKTKNIKKLRTGFVASKKCITPKMNDIVFKDDVLHDSMQEVSSIGYITSGCYSPHINKPISMGYIYLDKSNSSLKKKYTNYMKQHKQVNIKTRNKLNLYKPSVFPIAF